MNADKHYPSHVELLARADKIAVLLAGAQGTMTAPWLVYGVPRGGVAAAYLVIAALAARGVSCAPCENAADASLIVDDLVDSGATARRYQELYPHKIFASLYSKQASAADARLGWIVFPWENDGENDNGIADNIRRLIQYVEPEPGREGLKETPDRVARAWQQWTSGYGQDPAAVLKVFEDGAEGVDQMVMVKNIPLYSKCEHHMADIIGTATIAYIPNGKVVGLSKLSRVVDIFARRLQVQERLTNQVADCLAEHLDPLGVGVLVRARHMCMESRGVCQQGHHTITSALRGVIKDEGTARAEFMALATARD